MRLKRVSLGLLLIVMVGAAFGWKAWEQHSTSLSQPPTPVKGPAVILFRGDNSPSCQAIHHLVDQTAARYRDRINFVQFDWSADHPLIQEYRVRFLPTVVFVGRHDKEVGRIIGESPAVQQKLAQALGQLEELLGH